ncbi:uncharacterized protein MYCGRDRAFT_103274 [Zymoseptoria tritici IPO323]|uniref:Uncharacterized protein n=1 Tax=Zymoseptoria tritici (strain CBS 115943 / IPO323) TaxID=336722 RepID=F9X3R1_ZYMTI|nr:uncharacterized protein MYCGRDRAFT_103274 [Zymoseptoria tritici IPO323]EGP89944.1 hypothetical protein MYCGRDRAFT_103274 [Zymoseptoria tritici IPO323]
MDINAIITCGLFSLTWAHELAAVDASFRVLFNMPRRAESTKIHHQRSISLQSSGIDTSTLWFIHFLHDFPAALLDPRAAAPNSPSHDSSLSTTMPQSSPNTASAAPIAVLSACSSAFLRRYSSRYACAALPSMAAKLPVALFFLLPALFAEAEPRVGKDEDEEMSMDDWREDVEAD